MTIISLQDKSAFYDDYENLVSKQSALLQAIQNALNQIATINGLMSILPGIPSPEEQTYITSLNTFCNDLKQNLPPVPTPALRSRKDEKR